MSVSRLSDDEARGLVCRSQCLPRSASSLSEALERGPGSLTRSPYHEIEVPAWGSGKPSTLGRVRHLMFRTLVANGRIVGFWEYDPDSHSVHTAVFDRTESSADDVVAEEAQQLGDFIRDQLGHGKSYSLDTDDALRGRIARLREAFPVVE